MTAKLPKCLWAFGLTQNDKSGVGHLEMVASQNKDTCNRQVGPIATKEGR